MILKNEAGKNKNIVKYQCDWCSYTFIKEVGSYLGKGPANIGGKKQNGSDQIQCISCGNFIKTWE